MARPPKPPPRQLEAMKAENRAEATHFAQIPNCLYELGLSPFAALLYCVIKRTTGDDPEGYCDRSTATLARMVGCSVGAISKAKRELLRPVPLLGGKPLIRLTKRNGAETDYIKVQPIWEENFQICDRDPRSRGEGQRSCGEGQRSRGETKKNREKKNQHKKIEELRSSFGNNPQADHSRKTELDEKLRRAAEEGLSKARKFFRRKETTSLDAAELKAWTKAEVKKAIAETTEEEWSLLEWLYGLPAGEGPAKYRRRDLAALLNNWNAEISRARAAKQSPADCAGPRWNGRDMTPGVLPRQKRYPEPSEEWQSIFRKLSDGELPVPETWAEVSPVGQQAIVEEIQKRQDASE